MRHSIIWLRRILLVALAGVFAALAMPSMAQQSEMEKVEIRVAKAIDNLPDSRTTHKRVLILAFPEKRGPITNFGEYLAVKFSETLTSRLPNVEFINRDTLHDFLEKENIPFPRLLDHKVAENVARALHARCLVTGWSDLEGDSVRLQIEIYDYLQGGMVELVKAKVKKSRAMEEALTRTTPEFYPAQSPTDLEPRDQPVEPVPAGKGGVGYPECSNCPPPTFPPSAFGKVAKGSVILDVTIDVDGRAKNIRVQKSLGPEFDRNAMQAVRDWRFKPAYGSDGKAVPVKVLIEVTFRP
jgi:TonB family protein